MDCTPPDSATQGISQVRILEWVTVPFSGGLPHPGIEPASPALQAGSFLTEPPGKPWCLHKFPLRSVVPGLGSHCLLCLDSIWSIWEFFLSLFLSIWLKYLLSVVFLQAPCFQIKRIVLFACFKGTLSLPLSGTSNSLCSYAKFLNSPCRADMMPPYLETVKELKCVSD